MVLKICGRGIVICMLATSFVENGASAQDAIGSPVSEPLAPPEDLRGRTVGAPSDSTDQTDRSGANMTTQTATSRDDGVNVSSFGAWDVECHEPAVAGIECQTIHRMLSGDGSQVLSVFSFAYAPSTEQVNVQIALPLGFALEPGVRMTVGDGFQSSIPVSRCTIQGCIVEGVAASELIAAMRRENEGMATVQTTDGKTVNFSLPLNGFAEAFSLMEQRNKAARSEGNSG